MVTRFAVLALMFLGLYIRGQQCPVISSPSPGSLDIPVSATISWPPVSGITGFSLTLGTVPGGEDILSRRSAGLTNSFTPPTGLPENTRIYVTISMYLPDGQFIFCNQEMYFDTEDVDTPPPCTSLAIPLEGEVNVDNEMNIEWNYAPTATGYLLSMGTAPGVFDILNNEDVGNRLLYNPLQNLPPESDIFVRVVPYNENGPASECREQRFRTGSGMIDCGPFRDPVSGETVLLGPSVDFPSEMSVCLNELPTRLEATTSAQGYRWWRINDDNTEALLSTEEDVLLTDLGLYRFEAYNEVDQNGITYECADSRIFRVIASESPVITNVIRDDHAGGSDLTIEVRGAGSYEFALNDDSGAFQESPVFLSVPSGVHTIYVRDRNGCGTREKVVSLGLPRDAFPNFFTPNGDGINDFWQFSPSPMHAQIQLESLFIFDRFGVLLAQIHPDSRGWDGRSNGRPVPASNYWFRARDTFNNELTGYFALKR